MDFEAEWQADEERADGLIKDAGRYLAALKAWKKACKTGQYNDRQKAAGLAGQLAPALAEPVRTAGSAFATDIREYLTGDQWRKDVIAAAAADPIRLRITEENENLVSSPVIVRAQPGRATLQIGRQNWPHLRPRAVAAELQRLRDRTAGANSAEFLESLAAVWNSRKVGHEVFMRFRDVYDVWCLTPGWKRENSPAKFAQEIYALIRSGVRSTRSGMTFELITPSASAKPAEIYSVIAEDGRVLRYTGIRFVGGK